MVDIVMILLFLGYMVLSSAEACVTSLEIQVAKATNRQKNGLAEESRLHGIDNLLNFKQALDEHIKSIYPNINFTMVYDYKEIQFFDLTVYV